VVECPTAVSPEIDSASRIFPIPGSPGKSDSIPLCWYPRRISRFWIVSPAHEKRKCPGSMIPAWTGPTATSWIPSPRTRRNR